LSVDAIVGAARAHLGPDEAGLLAPTPGPLGREAVRVNHTGVASRGQSVIAAITALGLGLSDLGLTVDLGAAVAAAAVPLWEA
jgi:aspartate aminotransferase-like enzyme